MYDFAVVALLALGVVKVVDFLTDTIGPLQRMRSVLMFLAGLGAVWALDYSLFDRFGIAAASWTPWIARSAAATTSSSSGYRSSSRGVRTTRSNNGQ